jgi:hypothetical protein
MRIDRSFSHAIKKRMKTTYLASIVAHQVVGNTDGRLLAVEINLSNHGSSTNLEVLPLQSFGKEGSGPRASFSFGFRNLETTNSILRPRPVVEIIVGSKASSSTNLEETLTEGVLVPNVIHNPVTILTMELRGAIGHILLDSLEVWEHISSRPSRKVPVVVILSGTTVVKQHIGARGTTKNLHIKSERRLSNVFAQTGCISFRIIYATNLSSLKENISTIASLFTTSFELPVIFASEETKDSSWDTNKHVRVVGTTSLENQNLLAVFRKAISKETSSQTTTSNDVIILISDNLCLGS